MKNIFKLIPIKELLKFFNVGLTATVVTPIGQVFSPFGPLTPTALTFAATIATTIVNQVSYFTVTATASFTWNLTLPPSVQAGTTQELRAGVSKIFLEVVSSAGAWTVTFGTGITADAIAITSGKTQIIELIWNGSTFTTDGSIQEN